MTVPDGCACGCTKPLNGSEWWADERCLVAWLTKVNEPVPLPPEPVPMSAFPVHEETPPVEPTGSVTPDATTAGFPQVASRPDTAASEYVTSVSRMDEIQAEAEYMRRQRERFKAADDFADAVKDTAGQQADRMVGWLSRAFERLFGKGAA